MKRRGYKSKDAVCPYFRDLYDTNIVCLGEDGARYTVQHSDTIGYFDSVCGSAEWKQCPLASGLNKYYEEQEI